MFEHVLGRCANINPRVRRRKKEVLCPRGFSKAQGLLSDLCVRFSGRFREADV